MSKSTTSLLAALAFVALASLGCDTKADDATPAQPQAAPAPVQEISAAKLHQAYKQNEVAADDQFKGKTFNITGVVAGIQKDFTDSIYVTIKTGDEFSALQAYFDDAHKSAIAALKPGQAVKIQGRVDGAMMQSVMVKDCRMAQ